jgi:hypothetical protein
VFKVLHAPLQGFVPRLSRSQAHEKLRLADLRHTCATFSTRTFEMRARKASLVTLAGTRITPACECPSPTY